MLNHVIMGPEATMTCYSCLVPKELYPEWSATEALVAAGGDPNIGAKLVITNYSFADVTSG
jgi:hypothetical protein